MRLGKDLPNRSLKKLIAAVRARFTPLKKIKDITDNDRKCFRYMYWKRGIRSFNQIANIMNCIPNCVLADICYNFNELGQPFDKGKWSSDEDKVSIDGLKKYFKTDDLSKHIFDSNIKYKSMLKLINLNRHGTYCRSRWMQCLRWKIANYDQFEDNWSKSDASKLIYCLFKLNFSDESDIDWDLIKDKFSKITSFNNLMKNWRIIKSSVPDFDSKTYKQIIEYLYDKYLPEFIKTDENLKELEDFYNN